MKYYFQFKKGYNLIKSEAHLYTKHKIPQPKWETLLLNILTLASVFILLYFVYPDIFTFYFNFYFIKGLSIICLILINFLFYRSVRRDIKEVKEYYKERIERNKNKEDQYIYIMFAAFKLLKPILELILILFACFLGYTLINQLNN